ncbi:MAG: response regulator, partial [Burkholderiales bacterium]|nr:response regulator [Burkholderiales bacterium]
MQIAIVDDNPVNVTLLKVLSRQLPDTETVEFLDSRQGLAWCLANDPDLLIVDYMMPELDGMAFIDAFRAAPGKALTPILMITASSDTDVKFQALEKGANDLLTKPVDRAEFLARTRNMLVLRRNQKELADRASWLAQEVSKATAAIVARERETVLKLARA